MNEPPSSEIPSVPPSCDVARGRCPTEQALEVVASKWTVHIIYTLNAASVLRFSELRRALGSVTHKELTKQLRRLEQHGLVSRKIYPEVPPRVEYCLTALGATLIAPLHGLSEWARAHGAAVEASRRRYDCTADTQLEADPRVA